MEEIKVIKIVGNVINDEELLNIFLQQFAQVSGKKLLVHGGGKLATELANKLGVEQKLIEGRRSTDVATLEIVTMVYAGLVNRKIVGQLQTLKVQTLGISGVDGGCILAKKRADAIDYGYVGDIVAVDGMQLLELLNIFDTLVISPITADENGQLLNTNADTIAQSIAESLSKTLNVNLTYTFEKSGVLLDVEEDHSVISLLTQSKYIDLKREGKIFAGMIHKLDNAFFALKAGVKSVFLGKANQEADLLNGSCGTKIILDDE